MTVQTREYLGRNPRKRGAQWVEIRSHYDPFVDGLTLGGVDRLEEFEHRIGQVKLGQRVVLDGQVVTVDSHGSGSTSVTYKVSRTIKTKSGNEAEINSAGVRRVSSNSIVSTDLSLVEKKKSTRVKQRVTSETTQVGSRSLLDLDAEARKLVEGLLVSGGLKYSEIHSQVMSSLPDWHRSVSWVSNIAYYMRRDGRLKCKEVNLRNGTPRTLRPQSRD